MTLSSLVSLLPKKILTPGMVEESMSNKLWMATPSRFHGKTSHFLAVGTLVNAQATLHKTGSVAFCYGSGNSGSNSIAAGLEDDEFSLAFPMPLSGFNAGGVPSKYVCLFCQWLREPSL